ncbi:hypothetical protein HZH66_013155 [Vespula vulgaris]|uniref:Uncharacterized protein n=1 Tax=Vespula vulgaris TaxID=7454 RepID=A0A834J6A7_VESVU|nr:hypothetical protein HZH66_013155 [Vespula vulgaris]
MNGGGDGAAGDGGGGGGGDGGGGGGGGDWDERLRVHRLIRYRRVVNPRLTYFAAELYSTASLPFVLSREVVYTKFGT